MSVASHRRSIWAGTLSRLEGTEKSPCRIGIGVSAEHGKKRSLCMNIYTAFQYISLDFNLSKIASQIPPESGKAPNLEFLVAHSNDPAREQNLLRSGYHVAESNARGSLAHFHPRLSVCFRTLFNRQSPEAAFNATQLPDVVRVPLAFILSGDAVKFGFKFP
jgi:hypothetical protein